MAHKGLFSGNDRQGYAVGWKDAVPVTDGLVLRYDPGSESNNREDMTMVDESGYLNNGFVRLISNPQFSQAGFGSYLISHQRGGLMVPLDITGVAHNIHYALDYTIDLWIRFNTFLTGLVELPLYAGYNGNNPALFQAGGLYVFPPGNYAVYYLAPPIIVGGLFPFIQFPFTGFSAILQNWANFTLTCRDAQYYTLYLNGRVIGETFFDFKNSANRVNRTANGRYSYGSNDTNSYSDCFMGECKFYNRPLEPNEVRQNYRCLQSRYSQS